MANAKIGSHPSFGNQLVESVTSSFSLVPNDSGKVFICSGSACTLTLPALSTDIAGFHFTLINGENTIEHGVDGGDSKIFGYEFDETTTSDANQIMYFNGVSAVTFGDESKKGDKIECMTDGTSWYLYLIGDNN